MTLKEFANVDSLYRDLDTGQEVPWREYMRRVIEQLGIEDVKYYIPFGYELLKQRFKEDVHFNNTSYAAWLHSAGFRSEINRKTQGEKIIPLHYGLSNLFIENGITCFSPSDGVCVLKEAARIICETEV